MNIGEKIRLRRRLMNMKQEDLSQLVGVSLKTIQRWENGERSPRMREMEKLGKILEEPLSYFVGTSNADEGFAVNLLPATSDSTDNSKVEPVDSLDNGRDILMDNKAGHLIFRHGDIIVDIPDTPENKNLYWRVVEKMLSSSEVINHAVS